MSNILASLPADRLGCHSFKDVGRRVEIPASEAKDSVLLTSIAVTRELAVFCTSPKPQFPQDVLKRIADTYKCCGFVTGEEP